MGCQFGCLQKKAKHYKADDDDDFAEAKSTPAGESGETTARSADKEDREEQDAQATSAAASGSDEPTPSDEPRPPTSEASPLEAELHELASCVLTWGANECGQCMRTGTGDAGPSRLPRPSVVQGLSTRRVRHLFAGYDCSLAITGAQSLYAAGNNTGRFLTDAEAASGLDEDGVDCLRDVQHVAIDELEAYRFVAMSGGRDHLVAVTDTGTAVSWGRSNEFGQMGHGRSGTLTRALPAPVSGLPALYRVVAVACGEFSTFVLVSSGELYAWGHNQHGQLGLGDLEPRASPARLSGAAEGVPFRAVASGHQHGLALSGAGKVYAWGSNRHGQLGLGEAHAASHMCVSTPQLIAGVPFAAHVSAGGAHSAVVAKRARLLLAGDNRCGQLGFPRTQAVSSAKFRELDGMNGIRIAECGARCTICLSLEGELFGFGGNAEGQLGIGVLSECEEVPKRVLLGVGEVRKYLVHSLVVTQDHTCALAVPLPQVCEHCDIVSNTTAAEQTSERPRGQDSREKGEDSMEDISKIMLAGLEDAQPMARRGRSLKVVQPAAEGERNAAAELSRMLERPLVQPGVASFDFLALSVEDLRQLGKAAVASGDFRASAKALGAVLARPAVLNASFHLPGLSEPRLDACGLRDAMDILTDAPTNLQVSLLEAAERGAEELCSPKVSRGLHTREQLRALLVYLLLPYLRHPKLPVCRKHGLMGKVALMLAKLLPAQRSELLHVLTQDVSVSILRECFLPAVREFVNQLFKTSGGRSQVIEPALCNGALLMQLLYVASDRLREQQMSEFWAHGGMGSRFPGLEEFQISSVDEELIPPLVAYNQLASAFDVAAGPLALPSPAELLCGERAMYDEERAALPVFMGVLMVHRNLVPVAFKQKVLQVSNTVKQHTLMKELLGPTQIMGILTGQESLPHFPLAVRRSNIVEDTVVKLRAADPGGLKLPLKITFEGEDGLDEGGVRREFFQVVMRQLFDESYAMFVSDPDYRTTWFNMAPPESEDTDAMYKVCGIVVGLAVYNNEDGIQTHFPLALFKKLFGDELRSSDAEEVQPKVWRSLQLLMAWQPSREDAEQEFQDTFSLTFVASFDYFGETREVELKPGGLDEGVTLASRQEYVERYCDWLLGASVERQFKQFHEGFSLVVNSSLWSFLTAEEARLILCSEVELDFDDLRNGTRYDGFRGDERIVSWLWEVLQDFDTPQRKKFLAFTTGCDRAPLGGLRGLRLVVQRDAMQGATARLPTAHTCFNTLTLPEYGSKEQLRASLLAAVENSEGFGLE